MAQDETRKEFEKAVAEHWKRDNRMIEYCTKKAQEVIKIGKGFFIIEKPRIETSFCFGHGYCGISTREQEQDAFDMADYAQSNGKYFFNKNMEGLRRRIKAFSELGPNSKVLYKNNSSYYTVELCKTDRPYQDKEGKWHDMTSCYFSGDKYDGYLNQEEIKSVLEAHKRVAASFEKRLKTYLKRYGTSKLRTWTYLVD